MAKRRLEDVVSAELPVTAPSSSLRREDIVLRHSFPIAEVPAPQGPTILDKTRTKLASVGNAIAETGRWFNHHKIGVTRAIGTVAACAAVASTARATGDLGFYATIHDASKTFIDLDTPAEGLLAGGAASAISVMSALAAMTMNNFRREDAKILAHETNEAPEEPKQPAINDNPTYAGIRLRLTWMDEDDIFTTLPSNSVSKPVVATPPLSEQVTQLLYEVEQVLREESGQHQLVTAGY